MKSLVKVKKQSISKRQADSLGSISPSKRATSFATTDPKKHTFILEFSSLLKLLYALDELQDLYFLLISCKLSLLLPRQPPGPSSQEKSSTQDLRYFIFLVSNNLALPSFHQTLTQFLSDQPEDTLLSKHLDSQKKLILNYCLHQTPSSVYQFKHYVHLVTIEGESLFLLLITTSELILTPVMNAPYATQSIKIAKTQMKFVMEYRYRMEHKAVRIVSMENREYIVVCKTKKDREKVIEALEGKREAGFEMHEEWQQRWRKGEISNGEYLIYLNFRGNRSFEDLTQYPIMPWIVTDYKNESLNLNKKTVYRDLSLPIGALSSDKLDSFKSKYYELVNKSSLHTLNSTTPQAMSEKPYLYLSHYSTPGIVLYYLIRRYPQQNESYGGPPDRIFYDVGHSYYNGLKVLADNKELIPEFYFGDGDFMINGQSAGLGLNHQDEKVGNVTLPAWAQGSHLVFVTKLRQALESNYVSANLHKWIDLVFGYQQSGDLAQLANNLYQPTTLEENIDFTQLTTPLEQQALEAQLTFFGQCPVQVFKHVPHPDRQVRLLSLDRSTTLLDQDGLQQQCDLQREELDCLRRAYDESAALNEEKILKQMQEFKQLDELRKKQIAKYKEEGQKQIDKYKQLIGFLKAQKKQVKVDMENQFRAKEQHYQQLIEQLKAQLPVGSSAHKSNVFTGSVLSNSQMQAPNQQIQSKQLSTFFEKVPGSLEYVKTLERMPSKKKNGSAGGSRLGMIAQQQQLTEKKQQIKLKTINA